MDEKRKIRIRITDIVHDIRSGVHEHDLMTKYGLSSIGLKSAFKKLIAAKAVRFDEICGRNENYEDTCEIIDDRKAPRNYVVFEVPVADVADRANCGWVRDLTEEGLQAHGLETSPGSLMKLLVIPEGLDDFLPFTFEARCHWVSGENGMRPGNAGFHITNISRDSLEQLKRLIDFMTVAF